MKISKILPLFLCVGIALLAGCANPSKHPGQGGPDGEVALPNGDADLGSGLSANARPAGVNPETDVDYSVLEADTVYFDFDSSTIRASERGKLQKIADWLKDNAGKKLFLAGHADARGTPEYNRGLGERRAQATLAYLVGLGVEKERLFTISYGSERPAVQGENDEAYAKNRRVAPGVITK